MTFIKPMLAKLVDETPAGKDWLYEIKWDGFRAIAETGERPKLYSRNGTNFANQFPVIFAAVKKMSRRAILDGEIVALDARGRSRFELMHDAGAGARGGLVYYIFDILELDGKNLRKLPLIERKTILQKILPQNLPIKYSEHVLDNGQKFFNAAKRQKLEGIMAKKIDSRYEEGMRSGAWQKIKVHLRQEAVIVGYTAPRGERDGFGALALAVTKRGKLVYIGDAGTGFSDKSLHELYSKMKKHGTEIPPVSNPPRSDRIQWIRPRLVGEFKFAEWTRDGKLRQAVYLGLRADKKPSEVTRESASS